METQTKSSAKDVFINLGAIIALYTLVISLINLLFTVINTAYPQITNGYSYMGSSSISWPVATLIIFFPIFIFLMWLQEKEYAVSPEKQNSGIHKWLAYFTLFVAGIVMAGDLITVLYYFIDGQELTMGFILKVLTLLVITTAIFTYYLSDVRGALSPSYRMNYRIIAFVIISGSIAWGFSVLGSPHTQRLQKYDDEKVSDLTNINNAVTNWYSAKGTLPESIEELSTLNSYYFNTVDTQTQAPYEYVKTNKTSYDLCATFNTTSPEAGKPNMYMRPLGYVSWTHQTGHYCFHETINPNIYVKPYPIQ